MAARPSLRSPGDLHNPARAIIVTADDFGLDQRVNDAVEAAARHGILNTASLMVGAPAAADAVARALALFNLRVGLHLVLVDGPCLLPRARIPDLADEHGRFYDNMLSAGFRFALSRRVRAQLAAEIRAQFEAFSATGLALDHVNTHKHFHLHPTILRLIVEIGAEYGMLAVRLPFEPLRAGPRVDNRHKLSRWGSAAGLSPWVAGVRRRLRRAELAHPDRLFGLTASGHLTEHMLLKILGHLPPGVTEIYCHPATANGLTPAMAGYDHRGELAALLSPRVAKRLVADNIALTTFSALAAGRRPGTSA